MQSIRAIMKKIYLLKCLWDISMLFCKLTITKIYEQSMNKV